MGGKNKNFLYKFSIIVPCYNISDRIDKLFHMLGKTLNVSYEVIFIDDCSNDFSYEIMEKKKSDFDNFQVYQMDKNGGPGLARNLGLQYIQGEYVLFCDSDDEFEIEYLQEVANLLENLNDPDMLVFPHCVVRNGKSKKNDCYGKYNHMDLIKSEDIIEGYTGPVAKVFKSEIIKQKNIVFSNLMIGEDWCFVVNYVVYIKSAYKIDYCFYKYIMNRSSITHKYILERKNFFEQSTPFEVLQPIFKESFPSIELKMYVNHHLLFMAKQMCGSTISNFEIKEWYKRENKRYPEWITRIDYEKQSLYRKLIYAAMYYNHPAMMKVIMFIRKVMY